MAYPTLSVPVREMEQTIVRAVIRSAIAAGYTISLDNGGDDFELEDSRDKEQIFGEMFATDDESLLLRKNGRERFVRFVFGNDGWDVVCDYTAKLDEDVMIEANKISDAYQRILGLYSDEDSYTLPRAQEIVASANGTVELNEHLENRLKLLLQYSFKDTDGVYDNLTVGEKAILTGEEFESLKKWGESGKWIAS